MKRVTTAALALALAVALPPLPPTRLSPNATRPPPPPAARRARLTTTTTGERRSLSFSALAHSHCGLPLPCSSAPSKSRRQRASRTGEKPRNRSDPGKLGKRGAHGKSENGKQRRKRRGNGGPWKSRQRAAARCNRDSVSSLRPPPTTSLRQAEKSAPCCTSSGAGNHAAALYKAPGAAQNSRGKVRPPLHRALVCETIREDMHRWRSKIIKEKSYGGHAFSFLRGKERPLGQACIARVQRILDMHKAQCHQPSQ